jgi:hypothetical protein
VCDTRAAERDAQEMPTKTEKLKSIAIASSEAMDLEEEHIQ